MNAPAQPDKLDVEFFQETNGKKPAAEYLKNLKDPPTIAAIKDKLYQVQKQGSGGGKYLTGNAAGIKEFRFFDGAATRVYFIEKPSGIVVLGMSNKGGQDAEIEKCILRRDAYQTGLKEAAKLEGSVVEGVMSDYRSAGRLATIGARNFARDTMKVARRAGAYGIAVAAGVGALTAIAQGASASEVITTAADSGLPGAGALWKGDIPNALADASDSIPGLGAITRNILRDAGFQQVPLNGNEDTSQFPQRLKNEYSGPEFARHLQAGKGDPVYNSMSDALRSEYDAKIAALKNANDGKLPLGLPPTLRDQQKYVDASISASVSSFSQLPADRPIGIMRIGSPTAKSDIAPNPEPNPSPNRVSKPYMSLKVIPPDAMPTAPTLVASSQPPLSPGGKGNQLKAGLDP